MHKIILVDSRKLLENQSIRKWIVGDEQLAETRIPEAVADAVNDDDLSGKNERFHTATGDRVNIHCPGEYKTEYQDGDKYRKQGYTHTKL